MEMFSNIEQYMPHGMCLLWKPWLVLLWSGSDLLIFVAYMAIPFALFRVLRKRKDIEHRGLVALFGAFILLCGVTHALSIVTLWIPIYPYQGVVKLWTGLVSLITAVTLFRLVPVLVSLPSPADLQKANRELKDEIAAHMATLEQLREARDRLEDRVAERTSQLEQANAKMTVIAREAVGRSRKLISVMSSVVRGMAEKSSDIDDLMNRILSRLNALTTATLTVIEGAGRSSTTFERLVRRQAEPLMRDWAKQMMITGPKVDLGVEAAQQISLVIYELASAARMRNSTSEYGPSIAISWRIEGSGQDTDWLEFEWREGIQSDDVAGSEAEIEDEFGLTLLTKLVPYVLECEASYHTSGQTLFYRLRVPLGVLWRQDMTDAEPVQMLSVAAE